MRQRDGVCALWAATKTSIKSNEFVKANNNKCNYDKILRLLFHQDTSINCEKFCELCLSLPRSFVVTGRWVVVHSSMVNTHHFKHQSSEEERSREKEWKKVSKGVKRKEGDSEGGREESARILFWKQIKFKENTMW